MYLIVDAQALQSPSSRQRGIGRFARNLLRALTLVEGLRVEAMFNTALPAPDEQDLALTSAVHWFEPLVQERPLRQAANERFLGDWLTTLRADAVLVPSVFEPQAIIPHFGSRRPLAVAIVHDLIPLLFHEHYLRDSQTRALYGARFRRLAQWDVVLADSEATRADVIRLVRMPPDRVAAILGAAEPLGEPPDQARVTDVLTTLHIQQPFVLFVGGWDRRKNLIGAMAGFAQLPDAIRASHWLVIVCALSARQRTLLENAARRLGVADRVRLTGFVDDDALDILYRTCRLTLFPSYYEGLGLPVLEALLRGAPVVASNRSSIPEFTGPGARLVNPASPMEMAAAMVDALAEPYEHGLDERRRFAEGFRWSTTAACSVRAISQALATPRPRRPGRSRIAWVSPLPPDQSGIADYSAELLRHLPVDLDVTLVVAPDRVVDADLARRFTVLRPNEAVARHESEPFDLFVYHVGNSEKHLYMLDLMRVHAGLTVLHDVHLGGLALKAQETASWFGTIAASLEAEGATDLAAAVRRGDASDASVVNQATLNRPIIARSEAIAVHSGWSWARVRAVADVPVFHIPMGIPLRNDLRSAADTRNALGLSRTDFIVTTLGEVTPAKRIDSIISAVARLPERIRTRTQLLVVGDAPGAIAADLAGLAVRLGLGGHVRFTGRVALHDLGQFGRASDACVQLRSPARGETSGALLRALAAGSVCVVSDAGSFSEVPTDSALRVTTGEGEVDELCAALVRLHDTPGMGESLRSSALAWVARRHALSAAAEHYAAAMAMTIARRVARHGEWVDTASNALRESAPFGGFDDKVFARWARVHLDALNTGPDDASEVQ